jgi:hypothetical protein
MEFRGNIKDLFINEDNQLELYFDDTPSSPGHHAAEPELRVTSDENAAKRDLIQRVVKVPLKSNVPRNPNQNES